jgi:recombination protein RecA
MSSGTPALQAMLAALHRRWGPAALRSAAETTLRPDLLPTGVDELDMALGGGLPRGKLIELGGWPTSGMRTLALRALAQAQRPAHLAAYVDVCGTFDAEYAATCGVNLAHLLIARPQHAREIFDLTHALIASGDVTAVVIDSLDLVLQDRRSARLLEQALDRLLPLLTGTRCGLIVLQEEVFARDDWLAGSPLAHAATVRLLVEHQGWMQQPHGLNGYHARISVRKHPRVAAGVTATMIVPIQLQ